MISLTIGLVMLTALTAMFVNQNQARAELDRANRLVENGRYAMELLSDDSRLAGFYGELDPSTLGVPNPTLTTLPDPCSVDPAVFSSALRLHVQGYNNVTDTSDKTCLPAVGTSGNAVKPQTDILVIRRTKTESVKLSTLAGSILPFLQVKLCQYDTDDYRISTDLTTFILRQKDCDDAGAGTLAEVRQFLVYIYFISPENNAGDGIPTLKRVQLELDAGGAVKFSAPVALVEGIENMQVDYGIDTDNNGSIDLYSDCDLTTNKTQPDTPGFECTNGQWANVVATRINLLARNMDQTKDYTDEKTYALGSFYSIGSAFNDSYKRRVYSQFVRLVNPAGRRETP